jgi:predicted O-methyltransferase YrrM
MILHKIIKKLRDIGLLKRRIPTKKEQYENHKRYIEDEGLDKLFDWLENEKYTKRSFGTTDIGQRIPFPPEINDLVRLHKLIRREGFSRVLEFGTGYSTIVMADALSKNSSRSKLFTIDASEKWLQSVRARFPKHLLDFVSFHHSEIRVGTFNGQLCHYYESLPDIVPDFIYLDGPDPKDVKGEVNGLSFQNGRSAMAADLLLMEPSFLPGAFILVDGRTNNAKFLAKNFRKRYIIKRNRKGDVTTFELLGRSDIFCSDFRQ